MSLFVVDEDRCKKDGLCVAACPMLIIAMKDQDSFPAPAKNTEELCIRCGHCVAVCPHGALSHEAMASEACPPVRKDWFLDQEHVEHFLRSRRSIRSFKGQPVDRDLLVRLIDIARFAPSGHNVQPVRWLVVYDSAQVRRLAGMVVDRMRHMLIEEPVMAEERHMDHVVAAWEAGNERICRGAPHVIVAHAPEEERTAQAACTIALSYLELAAPSLGLGACWAGYFKEAANAWPPMQEALALPEGHITFGAMMVGYTKYGYQRLPLRNEAQITWR